MPPEDRSASRSKPDSPRTWKSRLLRLLAWLVGCALAAGVSAVIIVGDVLAADGFTDSYLYSTARRAKGPH